MSGLTPRQAVPSTQVPTLDGDTWNLADSKPDNFTLVVFYRGLHCPICSGYVRELDRSLEEFKSRGVEVVVISSDTEERARTTQEKWKLENVKIGHSLDIDKAREWGLFISSGHGTTSAGVEEPALFSEPGLFLVRPDGTLYLSSINTMPFARPHFDELLKALDFVIAKDYPARGEA